MVPLAAPAVIIIPPATKLDPVVADPVKVLGRELSVDEVPAVKEIAPPFPLPGPPNTSRCPPGKPDPVLEPEEKTTDSAGSKFDEPIVTDTEPACPLTALPTTREIPEQVPLTLDPVPKATLPMLPFKTAAVDTQKVTSGP